ncbi:MAG: hypothetical protein NVSMB25_26070 [Thermoleophilaceae bacterium]
MSRPGVALELRAEERRAAARARLGRALERLLAEPLDALAPDFRAADARAPDLRAAPLDARFVPLLVFRVLGFRSAIFPPVVPFGLQALSHPCAGQAKDRDFQASLQRVVSAS